MANVEKAQGEGEFIKMTFLPLPTDRLSSSGVSTKMPGGELIIPLLDFPPPPAWKAVGTWITPKKMLYVDGRPASKCSGCDYIYLTKDWAPIDEPFGCPACLEKLKELSFLLKAMETAGAGCQVFAIVAPGADKRPPEILPALVSINAQFLNNGRAKIMSKEGIVVITLAPEGSEE